MTMILGIVGIKVFNFLHLFSNSRLLQKTHPFLSREGIDNPLVFDPCIAWLYIQITGP